MTTTSVSQKRGREWGLLNWIWNAGRHLSPFRPSGQLPQEAADARPRCPALRLYRAQTPGPERPLLEANPAGEDAVLHLESAQERIPHRGWMRLRMSMAHWPERRRPASRSAAAERSTATRLLATMDRRLLTSVPWSACLTTPMPPSPAEAATGPEPHPARLRRLPRRKL